MAVKCDNCNKVFKESDIKIGLESIVNLATRLDPGGVVPAGECPACNALAYHMPRQPHRRKLPVCQTCGATSFIELALDHVQRPVDFVTEDNRVWIDRRDELAIITRAPSGQVMGYACEDCGTECTLEGLLANCG